MRNFWAVAFLLIFGEVVHAQSCLALEGGVPTIRSEGQTELVGSAVLFCTGVPSGAFDLDVSLNAGTVPITSRAGEASVTLTDSLRTITSTYPAAFIASPVLLENGQPANIMAHFVSIAVPSPDFQLVISGIRADASPAFVPASAGAQFGTISESLAFSKIAITNGSPSPVIFVAMSLPALAPVPAITGSISACSANAGIAAGSVAPLAIRISNTFPGAFKPQLSQPPRSESESGYSTPNASPAASGTQFAVTFGQLTPGVTLNLPLMIYSDQGGSAQLVTAEGSTTVQSGTGSVAGVPVFAVQSNSTVFYNVIAASAISLETFTVPVSLATAAGTVLTSAPTVAVELAPRGSVEPSAVPRFSALAGSGQPAPLVTLTACGLLTFAVPPNQSTAPQLVTVTGPAGAAFTASASQPWISITPAAGTLPAVLSIAVNPARFSGSNNQGDVDISSVPGGVTPYAIPITATVAPQPLLLVAPPAVALAFASMPGPATATQTLALTGLAPGTPLQASAIGTPWLSVAPATSASNGSLTITADITGLSVRRLLRNRSD